MEKPSGQSIFFAVAVVGTGLTVGYLTLVSTLGMAGDRTANVSQLTLADIPFNGSAAYKHLEQLCALGPRPSGSAAMVAQQKLLIEYFRTLGGTVRMQQFRIRHPLDGSPVRMANLLVQWHPERRERILLCAHYDTRPYPDEDRRNRRGTFVGANDGASGVALLMELARKMPDWEGELGVDFALFDGEEFVFEEPGTYFWGSEYFSRDYVATANVRDYDYRWAVLLDMVGDADLQIFQERNSASWRDTKPLVADLWRTAEQLGVREFIPRKKHEIRDDHLKLHNTAKIPTCNIIDFDYPFWHTEGDTPERCSALSLAKVGWVLQEWLKTATRQ